MGSAKTKIATKLSVFVKTINPTVPNITPQNTIRNIIALSAKPK
jgi:hypothetical protein